MELPDENYECVCHNEEKLETKIRIKRDCKKSKNGMQSA